MKQTSLMRTVTLVVLGLALLAAFGQEPGAFAQGSDKSTPSGKIDSALAGILEQAERGGVSAQGLQPEANEVGVPIEGNAVRVVVEVSQNVGGLVNAISRIMGGRFVQAQSQNFIELRIPLDSGPFNALLRLADLSGVAYIRPPLSPQTLTVSQGVSLTGADQLQSQGNRGQNTTVAVIDLGFAGLSRARSRGEIPSNVQTVDFTGSGLRSSSSHGTASAEVVHDMAPDADLVLMKVGDEVDLENAVDRAIQMGVDVVNHSVAWFNTNFYDGTGLINDAVRRARNSGILWVNAAGNYGQRHWQGVARDTDGNSWAEFSSGREGLSFSAQSGELVEVYLTWRDWPTSNQDYDLYVTNSFGSIVASSERVQDGSQPPTEHLLFSAPSSDDYEIRVRPASVSSSKQLAIFNLNQQIQPFVKEGSIVTPADCSCATAVGAVEQSNWTTGPIAPYSSQGPTTDGRVKPDLVGPAGVRVTTSQWNPFEGTSAAAPHVAGAAALLKSANTGYDARDLERELQDQATSMGSSTQFGSGRLTLTPSQPNLADLTIRNAVASPSNPRVGDRVTVSAEIVNRGNARAGAFSIELSDNSGTRTQSIQGLASGATATVNFTRTINRTNTNVQVTVDPFDQVNESDETNNSTSLTINARSQQPSLDINVSTDRSSYSVGDEIRVQFNTNEDGYVYLYNVDAQGSVQILYPRSESDNAFLRAGNYDLTNLLGVGQLTITDPTGTEDVHAVLASRSLNLGLDGAQSRSYDDPTTFRSVLSNRIRGQSPTPDWDWDVANFQVTRSQPRNRAPTARFSFNPNQPFAGDVVTFDASNSSDSDGRIVDWSWQFERNSRRANASGERVNVRFRSPGTVRATLTVTDDQGATDSTTQRLNVRRQAPQQSPTARFSVNPSSPQVNQTVTFDGRNSRDPDGSIGEYRWDLNGDGRVDATGARVQRSYSRSGSFQVTLTVVDNDGLNDSTTQTIRVSARQQGPTARFSVSPSNPEVNQTVSFNGRSSSDPDGRIARYQWDLDGNGSVDSTGPTAQARYTRNGTYQVTLRVTDDSGRSDSTTQTIRVSAPQDDPEDPEEPDEPSSNRMGFFIRSTEPDKLRLIVRGDSSWTEDHEFEIWLRRLSVTQRGKFESIEANVTGNAQVANINEDPGTPTMEGTVQDGQVEFNITVTNSEALFFRLQLDKGGDGELESGPRELPIFLFVEGDEHRVKIDVERTFTVNASGRTEVLPFQSGITTICDFNGRNCTRIE